MYCATFETFNIRTCFLVNWKIFLKLIIQDAGSTILLVNFRDVNSRSADTPVFLQALQDCLTVCCCLANCLTAIQGLGFPNYLVNWRHHEFILDYVCISLIVFLFHQIIVQKMSASVLNSMTSVWQVYGEIQPY